MTTTLQAQPGIAHVSWGSTRGRLPARRIGGFLLAVAGWLLAAAPATAADRWLDSYDDALATAEQSGLPILAVFTGSDWCVHCRTLEEKVLNTDVFSRWAKDRVVLLMVDLPQQGISQEERQARSRVCIKYGVRSFPSTVLVAPDGSRITTQSGYKGQAADAWLAGLDGHLPPRDEKAVAGGDGGPSPLNEAVETARDTRRPLLLMVSRPGDKTATTRVASLIKDPEFESLAREHFVVAQVPPAEHATAVDSAALETLLGGASLPADGVELVVTDDGQTPLYSQSGAQPPQRIVNGLRRFLAARQGVRR
jgi:thiol-disulfide isomerase/thioredoxin